MKTLTQELTEFCKENNIEIGKVGYLLGLIMKHKSYDTLPDSKKSSIDDYEFSLHQHWKEDDDRTNYDSPPIGGFKDY